MKQERVQRQKTRASETPAEETTASATKNEVSEAAGEVPARNSLDNGGRW